VKTSQQALYHYLRITKQIHLLQWLVAIDGDPRTGENITVYPCPRCGADIFEGESRCLGCGLFISQPDDGPDRMEEIE
jgi:hypothetical protein